MTVSSIFQTGISGMTAAKSAIATAGHNIANANTEGYSRQRVLTETATPASPLNGRGTIGTGTQIARIERINDDYLDKQIRNSSKELLHFEEKDLALRQVEDIFNEMNGDGLNKIISRFFNEFRKLANEPESEAVRQSVREVSRSLVDQFHKLRNDVEDVRHHLDSRLEGFAKELNECAEEVRELNLRISQIEITGAPPNDLYDKRDLALKKLSSYLDISMHKDGQGSYVVDARGIGPLVMGSVGAEKFGVMRSPANGEGKSDGSVEMTAISKGGAGLSHQIRGGKLGALFEVRDQTLATVVERLDQLAAHLTEQVNQVHSTGIAVNGMRNIPFFKSLNGITGAAQLMDLSDEIKANLDHIVTGSSLDSSGDNRVAIAIANIQDMKLMNRERSTLDDFYNSIVTDIGVMTARAKVGIDQNRDILTQLGKIREQISGVSIDEETANLMQYQHTFDASAKVIQLADEMLKTVLDLKR